MFFNKELGIAFGAEPKTGSRAVRDQLFQRNFIKIGGHHDSPSDIVSKKRGDVGNNEIWYGGKYEYFSTVRNPFDLIHSWLAPSIHRGRYKSIGISEIEHNFRNKKNKIHFPFKNTFFKHLQVVPRTRNGTDVLRYENLKEDLDRLFQEYGLDPIYNWKINPKYVTTYKPRGNKRWRDFWEPEAVEWFIGIYGEELERLGYNF